MKKTTEELDDLKKSWSSDPCWDLEKTNGFEDYREELRTYSDRKKKIWEIERAIKDLTDLVKEKQNQIRTLERAINALDSHKYELYAQ